MTASPTTLARPRRLPLFNRAVRFAGTITLTAGLLMVAWVATVWIWQDPFTAIYTTWKQHELAGALARELRDPRFEVHASRTASVSAEERAVAAAAARYRRTTYPGEPIGRIIVPRLQLNMVLVDGTDEESLKQGPGRDPRSYMPGQRQLVYVAGHRTTYLAPFSQIDTMRKGDKITLVMPYGTFIYRVTGHRIVMATDMSVLRSHGHEAVELQACHPRFFATHRYIVYALPVRVEPRGAKPYLP